MLVAIFLSQQDICNGRGRIAFCSVVTPLANTGAAPLAGFYSRTNCEAAILKYPKEEPRYAVSMADTSLCDPALLKMCDILGRSAVLGAPDGQNPSLLLQNIGGDICLFFISYRAYQKNLGSSYYFPWGEPLKKEKQQFCECVQTFQKISVVSFLLPPICFGVYCYINSSSDQKDNHLQQPIKEILNLSKIRLYPLLSPKKLQMSYSTLAQHKGYLEALSERPGQSITQP